MRRTLAPSQKLAETNFKIAKKENVTDITSNRINQAKDGHAEECVLYFSVAYGKPSKKKHKSWDGDGTLTVSMNTVILHDSDGLQLGSTMRKQLSKITFEEGASLYVAGKYVEILSAVDKPASKSAEVTILPYICKQSNPTFVNRDFRPVSKSCYSITTKEDDRNVEKVLFPRPSADHIFRYNQNGYAIVDVTLDAFFVSRMRPHQIDGVIFLYECVSGFRNHNGTGVILADAMGLGKSVQSIALIWTLMTQGPYDSLPLIRRCLIVCPSSLVLNWKAEFQKWLGHRKIEPYFVVGDCRIEKYISAPTNPILVVSYEMMTKHQTAIHDLDFDMIICDEAHRLKNASIKASLGVESLSIPRRVLLSGTPLQNDMDELFALSDFCIPGILGESKDAFRKRFVDPISKAREPMVSQEVLDRGFEASMELERITRSFMLRRTEIVNTQYLPPKDEMILFCRPTEMQLTLYRMVLSCQMIQKQLTDDLTPSGSDALLYISILRKLCNDPSLFIKYILDKENSLPLKDREDYSFHSEMYKKMCLLANESNVWAKVVHGASHGDGDEVHSGKLWVVAQMMLALKPSEKIVVASHFTKTLDILQDLSLRLGMKIHRIDGNSSSVSRMKTVVEFNDCSMKVNNRPEVLLLSCKAGGEGLNLVGANRIILYDLDWNPATDAQALARIWRDGQKKRVAVYRLVTSGTVEESLLQRQVSKDQLSNTCVDRSRKGSTSFSVQELKNIFSLHCETIESHGSWTHQLLDCKCQDFVTSCRRVSQEPLSPSPVVNPLCQLGLRKTYQQQRSPDNIGHLSSWIHWVTQDQIRQSCIDDLVMSGLDQISSVFSRTVSTEDFAEMNN